MQTTKIPERACPWSSAPVLPSRENMDRVKLDAMSLEELRQEASKYQLPQLSDKSRLIDAIMSHLERHGPLGELRDAFRTNAVETDSNVPGAPNREESATVELFRQALTAVTTDMLQQQKELQLQQQDFMSQQQQQFSQLMRLLLERTSPTRIAENQAGTSEVTSPVIQEAENGRTPNEASATLSARSSEGHHGNSSNGNSIKWLATQISGIRRDRE